MAEFTPVFRSGFGGAVGVVTGLSLVFLLLGLINN
jgi:hypothetical protein